MNFNKIILLLSSFYIMYFLSETLAINFGKVKNNMLRIYIFSSPRPIRKGFIRKIKNWFHRSFEKANIELMDVNSSYYSLTEEHRFIIETIISLNL